jgi:hypothetical protein
MGRAGGPSTKRPSGRAGIKHDRASGRVARVVLFRAVSCASNRAGPWNTIAVII